MSYRKPKIQNKKQKKKIIEKEVININKEEINENDDYNMDNIDDVIKAFEYFDINHTGKINIEDLTKALASFGDVMTEEEMEKIFREAGININNPEEEVDYMKFINFWIGDNEE